LAKHVLRAGPEDDTGLRRETRQNKIMEPRGLAFQSVRSEALENAQHDRADKGEREIGGHDAHAAGESHVTTPLVPRNAAGSQPNAAGSQPVPGVPLCAAATSLKMTEHNALKKP
jgi:hypothetical protein